MSIDLAGTIAGPTGSFALSNARNAALAGTVTGPTLAGAISNPREATLGGAIPGPTFAGALLVDSRASFSGALSMPTFLGGLATVPGTNTSNRAGGRRRRGAARPTWEPPVEAAPPTSGHATAKAVARAYAAATVTGTRAVFAGRAEKAVPMHRTRIVIGGRDVTFFRGVRTPDPTYRLIEPLLYGSGEIELPQVVAWCERPGSGALRWLREFAPVLVQRVDADGDVVATDYSGFISAFSIRGRTLVAELGGEAAGRAAMRDRPVPLFRHVNDAGRWWARQMRQLDLRVEPPLGPTTGITLASTGGTSVLDWLNELVARTATTSGNRRTITRSADGVWRMPVKDTTTKDLTVYFDDELAVPDLRRDLAEEPNRIFASAIAPDGEIVKFGVYPGLRDGDAPPYPMNDNSSFGTGTENADTDTGDGVTLMLDRLVMTGYLDEDDRSRGYGGIAARAVKALQDDAGLNETGNMNPATWRALWDVDVTGYTLAWSQIVPAAQRPKVRRWKRSASGAIIGRNPNFDPHAMVVDRTVDMGTGFTQKQVREWSRAELHPDGNNWVGTITLNGGAVIAGQHTPGDPIGELRRAHALRPGQNLWAPLFDGGTLFHISGVSVARDGEVGSVVTLTVDTLARDTMEVWQVIARNRETRRNPARQWVREHRSSRVGRDSMVTFDAVGGTIDDVRLVGGRWTVFRVVAGQEGTIGRLRIATNPNAEFAVAVFGKRITADRLGHLVGNPLSESGKARWTNEAVRRKLDEQHILLYAAGDDVDPCGHFPGRKSDDGPLTGRWEDDAAFAYRTFKDPVLYVGIWADRDATIPAGRIMWPQFADVSS